ncbi:CLUMA_CG004727, isoform A [Clunio marinus]|uniref:CLUMA_CG004727, isoform A n=1 Tax=Clunio marinus TaxID=568069 RepID=A0A1J1HSK6_9DIPT|nr:CLUMA_CG004727, isoform A [Clunio marinus]
MEIVPRPFFGFTHSARLFLFLQAHPASEFQCIQKRRKMLMKIRSESVHNVLLSTLTCVAEDFLRSQHK